MLNSHLSQNLMISWFLFGSISFQDMLDLTLLTLGLVMLFYVS